jgi:glycosyltransferase involved in cell wall biosynthesis
MLQLPRVSVITACLPKAFDYLAAAAESIERARAQVSLEWILVLDGPTDEAVPGKPDHLIVMPRQRGVSVARNFGLAKASSSLLTNLDGDDEIDPKGLTAGIKALEENTALGWVALNRLLTTGEQTVHWHGPKEWEAGEVAETWSAPMAFHSNTLVMRTSEVKKVGGWPALPACQDLALCLLLSERMPGASLEDVLIRYRSWDGQNTASSTFRTEQALAYSYIEDVVSFVRADYGREAVKAPMALGGLGAKPL